MHLAQGIIASEPKIRLQQHTISSCSPILGISRFNPAKDLTLQWARECIAFNASVLDWLKSQHGVEIVILSSRFLGVTTEETVTGDGQIYKPGNTTLVRSALIETANKVRALGARVIIVSPTPSSGRDNGLCLARASFLGELTETCNFPLDAKSPPFLFLRSVKEQIPIYWLPDVMCNRGICDTARGDIFLYRDGGHLSKEGSAYLGKTLLWAKQFKAMAD
jgi:hypothetical protein